MPRRNIKTLNTGIEHFCSLLDSHAASTYCTANRMTFPAAATREFQFLEKLNSVQEVGASASCRDAETGHAGDLAREHPPIA